MGRKRGIELAGEPRRVRRTLGDRETVAHTEIDRPVSGGVLLDGTT